LRHSSGERACHAWGGGGVTGAIGAAKRDGI
jgi:hypothetical protein